MIELRIAMIGPGSQVLQYRNKVSNTTWNSEGVPVPQEYWGSWTDVPKVFVSMEDRISDLLEKSGVK